MILTTTNLTEVIKEYTLADGGTIVLDLRDIIYIRQRTKGISVLDKEPYNRVLVYLKGGSTLSEDIDFAAIMNDWKTYKAQYEPVFYKWDFGGLSEQQTFDWEFPEDDLKITW